MKIAIELTGTKLPVAYRMAIVSFIKKCLEVTNEKFYKDMYFYEEKKNKKIKPFSFSVNLHDFKLVENEFQISDKITIIISTADYNLGINIYNGFLSVNKLKYKDYEFERKNIRLLKEREIKSKEVVFKALSPIVIRDNKGEFLKVENPDYVKELNYITDITLKSFRGYGLQEELQFTPVLLKKKVMKEEITSFKSQTEKKYFYITGYDGIFKLVGNIEDLNLLYKMGIGFRRSEGFGNLEVLG